MQKSPSGALSPYYYKGGYFHGVHYGSYFDDMDAFMSMMTAEEEFILKSPEKRRLLIDLYETNMTPKVLAGFAVHIERLSPRIIKLAVSAEKGTLKIVRRALFIGCSLAHGQMYFTSDMEEGKTWLVNDS